VANPLVHALVLIAAIIAPGGLLVYFAWRAAKNKANRKPTPEEAKKAFLSMYPKESLRAKARLNRLSAYKTRPHKKFSE